VVGERPMTDEEAQASLHRQASDAWASMRMPVGGLVGGHVPVGLTPRERFRLVEIAAATPHGEVREAALHLLRDEREAGLVQAAPVTGLDYRGG
jgi:hypothetical protein